MRLSLACALALTAAAPALAAADTAPPHILQQPALSKDLIAFGEGSFVHFRPKDIIFKPGDLPGKAPLDRIKKRSFAVTVRGV